MSERPLRGGPEDPLNEEATMPGENEGGQSGGPATDRHNEPVVDPTENVKALNAAEALRQDGLREIEAQHFREILGMRSECAKEISDLRALLADEKFRGVQREQALTEGHRIELKGDSEKALTAALSAQKEAAAEQNKSNTLLVDRAVAGMKELIVNNAQVGLATTNALSDKVEDLKASMAVIVNTRIGATEQKQEQRTGVGSVFAAIAMSIGVLSLIMTIVLAATRLGG